MTASLDDQVARVERAFLAAHLRMCEALTFEQCEDELSNLLHHLFRLLELKRGGRHRDAFHQDLARVPELAPASALTWVRGYDTHDGLVTAEPGDVYSDFYTDMYGVLVWAPRAAFDDGTRNDKHGRRALYDGHLEGQAVLDTLWDAFHTLKRATL